mmetsp:Transcript_5554/g.14232  ORF Transcript_5554/g.14232 Transcript_5554/m.14232 type:complete len:225 (+) Transcript_5554:673-1347(+)
MFSGGPGSGPWPSRRASWTPPSPPPPGGVAGGVGHVGGAGHGVAPRHRGPLPRPPGGARRPGGAGAAPGGARGGVRRRHRGLDRLCVCLGPFRGDDDRVRHRFPGGSLPRRRRARRPRGLCRGPAPGRGTDRRPGVRAGGRHRQRPLLRPPVRLSKRHGALPGRRERRGGVGHDGGAPRRAAVVPHLPVPPGGGSRERTPLLHRPPPHRGGQRRARLGPRLCRA